MVKVAVIVPAYNEEKAIAGVVTGINAIDPGTDILLDVIVINDCSVDQTALIASTLKCTLLDLPVNLGIGGAMQTGYIFAFENNYDYAMQVDGDGQHPPAEIPKLVHAIIEKNLDVAIGSRFLENKGFLSSFSRRMGILFFKHLIQMLCGIKVTDATSGFRIINKKALSLVSEQYPDEYPEPESIILFWKHNLKIGEVPVQMRERQGGQSSIRAFKSLYYMAKVSLAIFFKYLKSK